jgi:hypothetical protein
MVAWHVNEGLAPLIAQMKAKYPGIVVGTIGDQTHSAEVSDHNPNSAGRVNAADFMFGDKFTFSDGPWFTAWLIQDSRVHYVIFNRRIWTSETEQWGPYYGTDPHTNHVHLSVKDSAHTNTRPWKLSKEDAMTPEDKAWFSAEIKTQAIAALNAAIVQIGDDKWSVASTAKNAYWEAKNGHIQSDKILNVVSTPETPTDG